jgi:DNA segregation ATPase FtsK/SpoIIIE-like protein
MRLHLFQDDNIIKENKELSRKIDDLKWSEGVHITQKDKEIEQLKEQLKKEEEGSDSAHSFWSSKCERLKKENVQLLNDVSCLEDLLKNKKEEEKDTLSAEEEMNMVEVLSEELGEKEQKIMNLEKEFEEQKKVLEKAEDSIEMAVFRDIVYQCPQCEYLTENRCKRYADPKYPDQDVFRCWECRNDDTTSEEEEEDLCDICGSDRDNHDLHTLEDGRTFLLPCERHLIPQL